MRIGVRGERIAARWLKRRGFTILFKNYTCPVGEIDLIAREGDSVVFVEVKTRLSNESADPEVNVTRHKRRQIVRCARYFNQTHQAGDLPSRFDVVAVVIPESGEPSVEHFADAFCPEW